MTTARLHQYNLCARHRPTDSLRSHEDSVLRSYSRIELKRCLETLTTSTTITTLPHCVKKIHRETRYSPNTKSRAGRMYRHPYLKNHSLFGGSTLHVNLEKVTVLYGGEMDGIDQQVSHIVAAVVELQPGVAKRCHRWELHITRSGDRRGRKQQCQRTARK